MLVLSITYTVATIRANSGNSNGWSNCFYRELHIHQGVVQLDDGTE